MSPDLKKEIKSLVGEVSGAMTRIEGEKDFIREAIKDFAEKHEEIDKKILNKICRAYHKQNFHASKQDSSEFIDTYIEVFDIEED